jgi:hypothetical protein
MHAVTEDVGDDARCLPRLEQLLARQAPGRAHRPGRRGGRGGAELRALGLGVGASGFQGIGLSSWLRV